MNVQNKTLRVLGTIGGVLFSIALIISLLLSIPYSVSTSLVKPDTIVTIIKEVDFAQHVLDDESVKQALEQEGIQAGMINELLESPFLKDTVETYTDEVVAAVQGKQPEVTLGEDTVRQFADEHMDSLVTLTKKYMPESVGLTDDQIKTALDKVVGQYATTLVGALPSGEEVKEMLVETEIQKPVELLVSTTVPIVLYTIVGVLAAIIFVCLLHKFRGLLCLGIDALIVAAFLLAPYIALNNDALIASMLGDSAALVATLIAVLVGKLGVYLIVLAVIGVLFIAGYITYTVLMKKKAAEAAVAGALAEPASEEVAVSEPVPAEDG